MKSSAAIAGFDADVLVEELAVGVHAEEVALAREVVGGLRLVAEVEGTDTKRRPQRKNDANAISPSERYGHQPD